jgi:hypothetical protein
MKKLIKNRLLMIAAVFMIGNTGCAQTSKRMSVNILSVTNKYSEDDFAVLARYLETSYCPNEISVWTTGGLSYFGKSSADFGRAFGIGYTFFLNEKWGLSSGLEYAFYQNKTNINKFSDSYSITDIFGNPVIYQTRIDAYCEKQKLRMLNIPFSIQYQTSGKQKYYASWGCKLGFPVLAKYRGNNAVLNIAGYYPDYDQTEIWQNDLGYGIFPVSGNINKPDLGVSISGMAETGIKWNVGTGTDLYAGIFMDYGLNNMLKNGYYGKHLIVYNSNEPSKPVMNSVCLLSDRFSSMNLGMKLKMAFSLGCSDLLNDRRTYKSILSFYGNDN